MTGVGGVPASGVSAVVLNVTVTAPTAGELPDRVPNGTPRPLASNLNFVAGQTVPNLVVAKVGADGKVAVYNDAGARPTWCSTWSGGIGADEAAPEGVPRCDAQPGYSTPARPLDGLAAGGGASGPPNLVVLRR